MRKNDENKTTGQRFLTSVFCGAAIGFLLIIVLFSIFSALIAAGSISDSYMPYLTAVIAFVGAFTGALTAVKRYKGKLMAVGISVGAMMLIISFIGSVFYDSEHVLGSMTPVLAAVLPGGGIVGAFICLKRKKRKHA